MRRWPSTRTLLPAALAVALGIGAVVLFLWDDDDAPPEPSPSTATPAPSQVATATATPTQPAPATATAAPTATPTATPPPVTPSPTTTPSLSPSPTPTPTTTPTATPTVAAAAPETEDGRPWRCATVADRAAGLIVAVEEAMDGYEGLWGLALVDLDCDSPVIVRPQHSQYPASAGKIVILVAALRAVQDGLLEFAAIEEHVPLVLRYSLDKNTDEVAALLTPQQVDEVMARAGVSWRSSIREGLWRRAWFAPHDLALVWASIMRGEQLNEEWTAYLLQLASEAILPDGLETFPADFGMEGYRYGQKAGYYAPEDETSFFASAGYIQPGDGAGEGFAFAFLLETWEEDMYEPKRRSVFPLVRDFVTGEVDLNR